MIAQSREAKMDATFASLLETIRFLGGKNRKTKEEVLLYNQALRYANSLARLNTDVVDAEIAKRLSADL